MGARTFEVEQTHSGVVLRRVLARVIDDGLLTGVSILLALAMAKLLVPASRGEVLNLMGYPDTSSAGAPGHAILITGVLSTVLFLFYVGNAAGRQGATIGRIVAGIRIVGADGLELPAPVVFGRELMRVALVCLSLALVAPVGGLLGSSFLALVPDVESRGADLIAATVAALVPVGVVIAGWVGAALLDPQGRAPHDRLARSAVVRHRRSESPD